MQVGEAVAGQGTDRYRESLLRIQSSPRSCPQAPREVLAWKRTRGGGAWGLRPRPVRRPPVLGSLAQQQGRRERPRGVPMQGVCRQQASGLSPCRVLSGRGAGPHPNTRQRPGGGPGFPQAPLFSDTLVVGERGPSKRVEGPARPPRPPHREPFPGPLSTTTDWPGPAPHPLAPSLLTQWGCPATEGGR